MQDSGLVVSAVVIANDADHALELVGEIVPPNIFTDVEVVEHPLEVGVLYNDDGDY